jgi:hypothetical protein
LWQTVVGDALMPAVGTGFDMAGEDWSVDAKLAKG